MTGDEDGWTRGNREREIVYAKQRQHGSNIDGGTESANIPTEDFSGWSHTKIKAASDSFDSGLALGVSKDWENLASGFDKALGDFKQQFDAAVGAQWTGEGAEAAKQAISDYKSHAEKVSDGLSLMATKPAEVETAMTQIKGLMPEVVQVQQPQEHTQAAYEQYHAQQALAQQKTDEARMIMRNVWSPVSQQAGSGLPALPPAPQFADGAAAISNAVSSQGLGGGKDIKPDQIKPIDEAAVRAAAAAALADPAQASNASGSGAGGAAAAAAAGAAGGGSGAGGSGPSAASAAAAGAGGGAGTRPTSGGTTATGPNTGSVPGTYGIGRWGKPTTNKDDKDKDQKTDLSPLAGPIIAGSYTAGAGMGLSAAPSPSPMQGMGIAQPQSMMTPGAAGQHHQEDEDQHFTPEFLVSIDNGNELVGPLPKVSPAVIGVWNEEHVAYQNPHPSVYDPKPYDGEE